MYMNDHEFKLMKRNKQLSNTGATGSVLERHVQYSSTRLNAAEKKKIKKEKKKKTKKRYRYKDTHNHLHHLLPHPIVTTTSSAATVFFFRSIGKSTLLK